MKWIKNKDWALCSDFMEKFQPKQDNTETFSAKVPQQTIGEDVRAKSWLQDNT